LLPEILYFSFNTGLFHAYYLIMIGPALAALVGGGLWALSQVLQGRFYLGWALAAVTAGLTLYIQGHGLASHDHSNLLVLLVALTLVLAGLALLAVVGWRRRLLGDSPATAMALGLVVLALVVGPLYWSFQTALNTNPDVALPRSGPPQGQIEQPSIGWTESQQALLDYLAANTRNDSYLLATLSAHQASPLILATGRPVLTFGGFNGADNVVDVGRLAEMVSTRELRYVVAGQQLSVQKPEIGAWVRANCSEVRVPGTSRLDQVLDPGPDSRDALVLFDCASIRGAE
jgi:4-amino-4-deoxy-L-arabinose transferase-like glycosyltransferase